MRLSVQIKLLPTGEQAEMLRATMRAFNEAASLAALTGFGEKVYRAAAIQKLCYRELRSRFGLSSQMAVQAIRKAAEVFGRQRSVCPQFAPLGAMTFDDRILSWKAGDTVSILTLAGRIRVPFVCGERQRARLAKLKGEVELVCRRGGFYLHAPAEETEPATAAVSDFVGVDFGIVQIATTDDGTAFTGRTVDEVRERCARARATYQRRGTRSARRRLRKLARRQRRFQANVNHTISKRLVAKALHEGKGLAVEDLTGIRARTERTVQRSQRDRHSNWSFFQLREFLAYKARLVGVPVSAVDPRNTSRTCAACGHCDKGNRRDQRHFVCLACGLETQADQNGAKNIRSRALGVNVNHPELATAPAN